jgi:hypothetical protein
VPKRPRRIAIAGAPVRVPTTAATESISVPMTVPAIVAVKAAVS